MCLWQDKETIEGGGDAAARERKQYQTMQITILYVPPPITISNYQNNYTVPLRITISNYANNLTACTTVNDNIKLSK